MTGIILAGGSSCRMGKDKAQLPWGKSSLRTAIVDKLRLLCREIVIVGPRRALDRDVRWTEDHVKGKGPLAGLQAGLEAAAGESALVLPCDMPGVPLPLLKALVQSAEQTDIVLPVHSRGLEPLCAWYSKEACLPVIEKLLKAGCFSMIGMVPHVRVRFFHVETHYPSAPAEQLFANLNFPADYEREIRKLT